MRKNIITILDEKIKAPEDVALVIAIKSHGTNTIEPGSMMLVFPDGEIAGTIGGGSIEYEIISRAKDNIKKNRDENYTLEGESYAEFFIKVFKRKTQLFLFGAGHVAHEIYKLAHAMSYDVYIVDTRKELCNEERFKHAKGLYCGDVLESIANIETTEDTFIILAGPDHKSDEIVLEAIMDRELRYIGLLGSRKKLKSIRENILEKGKDIGKLKNLYSPIGIDVGSNNPSELALGILTEMTIIKNERIKKEKGYHKEDER